MSTSRSWAACSTMATSPFAAPAIGHRAAAQHRRAARIPQSRDGALTWREAAQSSVDDAEVERFSRCAADWWDPRGPMAALHKFNPVRLGYIRDQAAARFDRDAKKLDCLKGLRMLDIGCGGGILSEPLARLGAQMVGADPSAENIAAARAHAEAERRRGRLPRHHRRGAGRRRRALRRRAGDGGGRARRRRRRCSSQPAPRWSSRAG